jgi:dTDP-4-amino-4,6-dideoxygalactose transaminase
MNIPMVDLKGQYEILKDEIEKGFRDVLENTQFILGPNVRALEEEVAAYCRVKHAIAVASGTDALHLALRAAGIGEGDEVITTPFTFIATAEAISYVGARPVFVDIDPETFNIDVNLIEAAISERTAAILPVHLFVSPPTLPPSRISAAGMDSG